VNRSPTTIDLVRLLDGPRTRTQLGATRYAIGKAEQEGTIQQVARPQGGPRGLHYKLTTKGRARARRAEQRA
jgi:DNA-binding PadR family transcriptional regulator